MGAKEREIYEKWREIEKTKESVCEKSQDKRMKNGEIMKKREKMKRNNQPRNIII